MSNQSHIEFDEQSAKVTEGSVVCLLLSSNRILSCGAYTTQLVLAVYMIRFVQVVYGEGNYSADMFSAGVTLLELWVGSLWGESKVCLSGTAK